jgi:hypothetical protein
MRNLVNLNLNKHKFLKYVLLFRIYLSAKLLAKIFVRDKQNYFLMLKINTVHTFFFK